MQDLSLNLLTTCHIHSRRWKSTDGEHRRSEPCVALLLLAASNSPRFVSLYMGWHKVIFIAGLRPCFYGHPSGDVSTLVYYLRSGWWKSTLWEQTSSPQGAYWILLMAA
jgi:hypothetical protein